MFLVALKSYFCFSTSFISCLDSLVVKLFIHLLDFSPFSQETRLLSSEASEVSWSVKAKTFITVCSEGGK